MAHGNVLFQRTVNHGKLNLMNAMEIEHKVAGQAQNQQHQPNSIRMKFDDSKQSNVHSHSLDIHEPLMKAVNSYLLFWLDSGDTSNNTTKIGNTYQEFLNRPNALKGTAEP